MIPGPDQVVCGEPVDVRFGRRRVGHDDAMTSPPDPAPVLRARAPIPVRRFAAFWAIGVAVVGAALLVWTLITSVATVIGLVVVAAFFAIVLTPAVDALERRTHVRRGIATLAVFLAGVIIVGALAYAFARPIYDASSTFTKDLPHTIHDAERGRGEVGRTLRSLGAQDWVRKNLPKIQSSLSSANGPLVATGKVVVSGVVALVTVLVLTFLILMQTPNIAFVLGLFPETRANRIRRVGLDAAGAVSGYITGNLVISLIAGLAIYAWLLVFGVAFALVLALWVAFADLLPLVGATIGAIPAIFVAFLQSPGLGIATLIFFVAYQTFENRGAGRRRGRGPPRCPPRHPGRGCDPGRRARCVERAEPVGEARLQRRRAGAARPRRAAGSRFVRNVISAVGSA